MGPFWAKSCVCILIAILTTLGIPSAARSQAPAPPTLELGEMTFVVSEGTQNEVVLVAEHARVDTVEKLAHLKTVHLLLAPDRDTPGLNMRCERGTVDMETSDFDAEGNVRGVTGDGKRFRTQRLRYQHGPGLVSTKSPVDIEDDAGSYTGNGGFRYYVRENRFQLHRAATVVGQ
jgi:LPS export ABC transporter protein LptC